MKREKTKIEKKRKEENKNIAGAVKSRGKTFEGNVIKKFPKRVVIEFERSIYVRKYERYAKSRTRIHARVPENLENEISVGDYIKVQECRPLSKIIHFIVIEKIKSGEVKEKNNKNQEMEK